MRDLRYVNVYQNAAVGAVVNSLARAKELSKHSAAPAIVLELDFDVLFPKPADPAPAGVRVIR